MNAHKLLLLAGVCLAIFALPISGGGKKPSKDNLNNIGLEVLALQTLDEFELRPAQLQALAELARDTGDKGRKRAPAKVSPQYRQTLLELHAALIKRSDQADELDAKLQELAAKEDAELDTDYDITDAARQKAPETGSARPGHPQQRTLRSGQHSRGSPGKRPRSEGE
jgi:hypothetical protein